MLHYNAEREMGEVLEGFNEVCVAKVGRHYQLSIWMNLAGNPFPDITVASVTH